MQKYKDCFVAEIQLDDIFNHLLWIITVEWKHFDLSHDGLIVSNYSILKKKCLAFSMFQFVFHLWIKRDDRPPFEPLKGGQ